MSVIRAVLLLGAISLAACGPMRNGFEDTGTRPETSMMRDVTVPDVPNEASMDAPAESGCDDLTCLRHCLSLGGSDGICTQMHMCRCIGVPDGPVMDSARDMGPESSVISCTTNGDCPPSTYCNGPMCTGAGFCSPRSTTGATDAASCGTTGPTSCGCDGVTYPNVCARVLTGVRQASPSMCMRDGSADATMTDAASDATTGDVPGG